MVVRTRSKNGSRGCRPSCLCVLGHFYFPLSDLFLLSCLLKSVYSVFIIRPVILIAVVCSLLFDTPVIPEPTPRNCVTFLISSYTQEVEPPSSYPS